MINNTNAYSKIITILKIQKIKINFNFDKHKFIIVILIIIKYKQLYILI